MEFKQDFLGDLKVVEKYDRSCKLTVQEVIPAYPEIVKFAAMIFNNHTTHSGQRGEIILRTENSP